MLCHKGCLLALVVVAYVGLVSAQQRQGSQRAYAFCTLNGDGVLSLEFTLDLNGDPEGFMEVNQAQAGLNCPLTRSGNTWNRRVEIDASTRAAPAGQSSCNRQYNQLTGGYTWQFAYYELANYRGYDLGLNRIYTVTCNNVNTQDLRVQADIAISTPNLGQVVNPYIPDVSYTILVETAAGTGNYRAVTPNDIVPTQTLLKLELVYNYGTYDANKKSHIAGLRTIVSPNPSFTGIGTQDFFTNQGCPTGTLSPDFGFRRVTPTVAGTSVRQTAAFPAFKFDVGQADVGWLYFRTYIDFCSGPVDSMPYCNDPCDYFTNLRKRRAATGDEEEAEPESKLVIVAIRIGDSSQGANTADKDDAPLYGIIGAVIGIGAVLCVALCVALLVCGLRRRRRRRREEAEEVRNETKIPPQVFVNE